MMNYSKTDHSFPRVAVVGCGAWGKNLVRNFAELGALAAVYDSDPFKAKDLASQYGLAAISEEEIFSHPSLDAIVISSIAPLHAFHAEQALKAGKHVYIEKPMALSVKDAQKLCSLAKTHNRLLMVGHILHYHPAFIALQERLPELGPLKHIYANRLALGRFRNQENVLWDLASHDISLILALTQDMPKSMTATAQTFLSPQKPASALLTLAFSDGLTAHIHTSWLSPFKEQKLVVVGENGIAVFDDCKPWAEKLQISKECFIWQDGQPLANSSFQTRYISLPETEPLKNECLHFLTCIQTSQNPVTSGLEGLRVTKVLEKAEHLLQERHNHDLLH
ncbi:MAG: Gfo/Idh/MocA family oxidoreductase [Alphaproteobacteria bacterium]|nr:Gfo/Idh/MocA family oxidoreductase [Alphaproteobacteria bacterium]MBP9777014.1 Gfo/Idh/MocA family oxidoreductase [Alphaproteobacteria bacterium]